MKNRTKYIASEKAIREHLRYDGAELRWTKRPAPHSSVVPGDIAGSARWSGHRVFKLCGHQLFSHIVIWWLLTGSWPKEEVDHIDCNPGNNSFSNLRESTRAQNARNRRPHNKTGSGLKGAYTHSSMNGKWFAQIVIDGRQIHLGRYDNEEAAHAAYVAAAKIHHGEFARVS